MAFAMQVCAPKIKGADYNAGSLKGATMGAVMTFVTAKARDDAVAWSPTRLRTVHERHGSKAEPAATDDLSSFSSRFGTTHHEVCLYEQVPAIAYRCTTENL